MFTEKISYVVPLDSNEKTTNVYMFNNFPINYQYHFEIGFINLVPHRKYSVKLVLTDMHQNVLTNDILPLDIAHILDGETEMVSLSAKLNTLQLQIIEATSYELVVTLLSTDDIELDSTHAYFNAAAIKKGIDYEA